MELQPEADGPQILAADALYQLGRVEEAYRLLLSAGPTSHRAPILARLALLQLQRGFLYDTNQVCVEILGLWLLNDEWLLHFCHEDLANVQTTETVIFSIYSWVKTLTFP